MHVPVDERVVGPDDFDAWTAPYRRELLAHCYRMTGSVHDAEDALQETMVRAWRAADRYDPERASVRTWLHRIATNTCLTALAGRGRRPLPSQVVARSEDPGEALVPSAEVRWLEPWPGGVTSGADDPATAAVERESLRLAFVAAAQRLPARQRAILLLREVLQWSAAEVADCLDLSVAAVNSGLQRARATLRSSADPAGSGPEHLSMSGLAEDERAVVERYAAAFEQVDLAALVRLLRDDVVLEMPPVPLWYAGVAHYRAFMERVFALRGERWRTVPIVANGQAGFAAYARHDDGRYRQHTLQVLDVRDGCVARNVVFADPSLFARFGLPAVLDVDEEELRPDR